MGGRSPVVCVDGSAGARIPRAGLTAARHHPRGRPRCPRRSIATGLPIEEISCGNAFLIVPVRTRAAVDAAEADLAAMRKLKSAFPGGHVGALFFSTEPIEPERDAPTAACSRPAPASSRIRPPEAPPDRSACYLVKHGLVHRDRDAATWSTCRAWRWAGRAACTCASREDRTARSRACRSGEEPFELVKE